MKIALLFTSLVIVVESITSSHSQRWNISNGSLPWQIYLKLSDVQKPFGLELNRSSLAHYHFAVGHLCLHSFMYDAARDAFALAVDVEPTLVEAHIGLVLR